MIHGSHRTVYSAFDEHGVTMGYALGSKCLTSTDFDQRATPQDAVETAVTSVMHEARRNMLGEWTLYCL